MQNDRPGPGAKTGGPIAAILGKLASLFRGEGRSSGREAVAAAEQKASRAETRLRDAIDALPEGLVFLDAEGRYILWNKRYAEIYRRSADLFLPGARLEDTLRIGIARGDYPDAIGREEEWLASRMALMANPGERHEQRIADGRWILIEERRTTDGGTIGIRVDITDLKRAEAEALEARERAEAANRAKSEFLANMSHELKTPLNGVLGLSSVLERTPLDAQQAEIVGMIMGSATQLNELLGDILDISRIESGKVEIEATPFDVRELVDEVVRTFAPRAAQKGLALDGQIALDAGEEAIGDRARLRQVLAHLLDNAVKFTAAGNVRLAVRARPDGDRKLYIFEVADTGIGFDEEMAGRLFQRFEQADGSNTRQYGGAGLGLAICRGLTEIMGGSIHAVGKPGEGATFTVEAPMTAASEAVSPAVAGR